MLNKSSEVVWFCIIRNCSSRLDRGNESKRKNNNKKIEIREKDQKVWTIHIINPLDKKDCSKQMFSTTITFKLSPLEGEYFLYYRREFVNLKTLLGPRVFLIFKIIKVQVFVKIMRLSIIHIKLYVLAEIFFFKDTFLYFQYILLTNNDKF